MTNAIISMAKCFIINFYQFGILTQKCLPKTFVHRYRVDNVVYRVDNVVDSVTWHILEVIRSVM